MIGLCLFTGPCNGLWCAKYCAFGSKLVKTTPTVSVCVAIIRLDYWIWIVSRTYTNDAWKTKKRLLAQKNKTEKKSSSWNQLYCGLWVVSVPRARAFAEIDVCYFYQQYRVASCRAVTGSCRRRGRNNCSCSKTWMYKQSPIGPTWISWAFW